MKFYYAPMEGVTGYVLRNVHHTFFTTNEDGSYCGVDKYYTPFCVAGYTHNFKTREKQDILPENNIDLNGSRVPLVPQILANHVEDFLWGAQYMADLGYEEVNLNLGCPVGTVTAKKKGSGMLQDLSMLDGFLDGIFNGMEKIHTSDAATGNTIPVKLSVKTRIGFENPEEYEEIFRIYRKYPICELTVHPRTRKEFYSGKPHLETFSEIRDLYRQGSSQTQLVYNGNINTVADYTKVEGSFPGLQAVMIGRALVGNPALVREIRGGSPASAKELRHYHDALLDTFRGHYAQESILINHMKEFWAHMGPMFQDNGRYLKNIHKAKNMVEYRAAVTMIFNNCPLQSLKKGL